MRTIAALLLAFSAQAFACPNLAGSFTCTYQNGQKEVLTVTQDMKGGFTVYNINGSEMPADNQVRTVPDDENIKNGTFRAWCDDDMTLKGQLLGKYYNNGSYFGDLTANIGISMDNGNLKQSTTGDVKTPGGQTYPIDSETTCTKN